MSINPTCYRCGSELKEFGAILLSPPNGKSVDKFHICTECYSIIIEEINKYTIKKKFKNLSHKCHFDTRWSSNLNDYLNDLINHPAYQEIISMGTKVVPFILMDLMDDPKWWFYALKQITGENPVPEDKKEEYEGYLYELTTLWLDWGRKNKYI